MRRYFRIFCWAFLISLLGSLAPGSLNVTVAGMAADKQLPSIILFSVAAVSVEVIVVRLLLVVLKKILEKQLIFNSLKWVTCCILLVFATVSIVAAVQMKPFQAPPYLVNNAFVSGMVLSALNPLQIPFWLAWTLVLQERKILSASPMDYTPYVAGIGVGTAAALALYALLGNLLIGWFNHQQHWVNVAIGVTLLVTAIIIAFKKIKKIEYT